MGYPKKTSTAKKTAPGTDQASVKKILNRLARLEGQVKGIRRMIEEGQGCSAVITQISAVKQAAAMLATELLENEVLCRFEQGRPVDRQHLEQLLKLK